MCFEQNVCPSLHISVSINSSILFTFFALHILFFKTSSVKQEKKNWSIESSLVVLAAYFQSVYFSVVQETPIFNASRRTRNRLCGAHGKTINLMENDVNKFQFANIQFEKMILSFDLCHNWISYHMLCCSYNRFCLFKTCAHIRFDDILK